jgi:hypothetical protein
MHRDQAGSQADEQAEQERCQPSLAMAWWTLASKGGGGRLDSTDGETASEVYTIPSLNSQGLRRG